jgi:hypothetical protein
VVTICTTCFTILKYCILSIEPVFVCYGSRLFPYTPLVNWLLWWTCNVFPVRYEQRWRPCLRSILPKSSVILCFLLWLKELNAKEIHKQMFHIYCGKCLCKLVYNWVETFSQWPSEVADDARPGAGVAETRVRRLPCCKFRSNAKAMGQVYQCWWRICREINTSYHMFYVLYQFVTYLLKPPRIYTSQLL